MFLSFVIPIYNDEKFLTECLDSCLNQQLSKDDYEIICVDDGSTDRTPEILNEYAARYPNIRLIFKQHGSEYGSGRDIGLDAAVGEYVWFVDHDDLVAANSVDKLKQIVEENPGYDRFAFSFYHFNTKFSDEELKMIREGTLPVSTNRGDKDYHVWSCIFRRAFLNDNGIRPRSRQIDEAGAFWGIEQFTIFGHDWAILNECFEKHIRTMQLDCGPLYFYRLHTGQAISSSDPEKVQRRNQLRRNKLLFLGHRAFLQKQRWLELADTDPKASQEALIDTIMRLRQIAVYSGKTVVPWAWKDAMNRLKEKDIFFRRKPKAYSFSLLSFLNNIPIKERYRFSSLVLYYSFTYRGAMLYYKSKRRSAAREARRIKKLAKAEDNEGYSKALEAQRDKKLVKTAKKESHRRAREARRAEKH